MDQDSRYSIPRSISRSRTPTRYSSQYSHPSSYQQRHPRRKRHKEKLMDCCRNIVAFMCTQVGVGALILGYSIIGAFGFMHIERWGPSHPELEKVESSRNETVHKLFLVTVEHNILNPRGFYADMDGILKEHQNVVTKELKHGKSIGYDERSMEEIWNFPASLMFSLSIITMIGYGNMVPITIEGKILTMMYALFGIPLYILYFKNMGKILAGCYKWVYRRVYECSTENDHSDKKIIVPSSSCLWVIFAYILTGSIMFHKWENWDFLDSAYFCVTSLCKIGFGDLVPGADVTASNEGNQTKLVINFIYMLLGLGLIAMCYNLMREEIKVKLQELNEDFMQCLEDTKMRFLNCCGKKNIEYYDDDDGNVYEDELA